MISVVLALLSGMAQAATPAPAQSVASASAATSPDDKIANTARALAEMREAVETINGLIKDAESATSQDPSAALVCLNGRLSSLQVLVGMIETAQGTLQDAKASGDVAAQNFEYRKVLIAQTKTRSLVSEARRCSAGSGEAGAADTTLVVDDGGVGQDTTTTTTTPTGTSTPTDITVFQ